MTEIKQFPQLKLVNEPRKLEISNKIRQVLNQYDMDIELMVGILDTVKAQIQYDAFKRQEES